MEADYTDVISQIKNALSLSPHRRILVAVAGPPGSGKTTIATHIVALLNKAVSQPGGNENESAAAFAISVSVDGFDTLPNRDEAYVRRGAPWTFDVDGIVKLVTALHDSAAMPISARNIVKAPSFDHALKDPVEDDIQIGAETKIIILEGNYLLLNMEKWREIALHQLPNGRTIMFKGEKLPSHESSTTTSRPSTSGRGARSTAGRREAHWKEADSSRRWRR
jgi:pantothenate kinase